MMEYVLYILISLLILFAIIEVFFKDRIFKYLESLSNEKEGKYVCCRRNFKEIVKRVKDFAEKFGNVIVNTTGRNLVINAPELKEPLIIRFSDSVRFFDDHMSMTTGVIKEGKICYWNDWRWDEEGIMELSI